MIKFQQKTIAMLLTVFFLLSASLPGVASAERLADEGNSSAAASAAEPEEPETDAETETETLEEEDVPLAGGTKGGARGSTSVLASVGDHIAAAVGVNSVTYEFEDNDLSVTARANSDALPEDVTLEVVDLSAPRQSDEAKKDYHARQDACSEAKELLDQQLTQENYCVKDARAYDIHFVTSDGKEVQPDEAVQVSMRFKNKLNLSGAEDKDANVQMAHILEQEKQKKQVEQVSADLELSKDGAVKEAGFAAESFSIYVVYTVDFSYVANGTEFAYSIRGGSAIGLKELLPLLGVVNDDASTEIDEVSTYVENIADVKFSDESLVKVTHVKKDTTVGQLKRELNLSPDYSGKLTESQIAELDAMAFTAPDWVLISIKAFSSEETLTLTMNNGETVTIEVTDQANGRWEVWFDGTVGQSNQDTKFYAGTTSVYRLAESNGDVTLPTDAQTAHPSLYNYTLKGWYDIRTKKYYQPGATARVTQDTVFYADWVPSSYSKGPASDVSQVQTEDTTGFVKTEMFDYNELINTNFCTAPGRISISPPNPWYYGAPNLHSETWNASNEFAFISWNYNWNPQNSIGMPGNRQDGSEYRQKNLTTGIYGRNTTLINNLFNDTAMVGKTVVGEGNYLFDYNETTKEYFYDSGINAATYNQNDKRFYVYDQHEYLRHSDGNLFNNFLPFNDYPGGTMPDENTGATNYWFGMKNTISFYLPDDVGKTVNGGNVVELENETKKDMVFKFSGDDDVWVFVDGNLVLDLGGIHDRAGGEINFNTGEVCTYFGTITDHENNTDVNRTNISTPAVTALKEGNHTLTVLYLERGSSLSNCAIYFNLLPQPKTVTVEKQLDGLTEEDRRNYEDKEFQYEVYVKEKGQNSFSLYNTPTDADSKHQADYKKSDGSTEKIYITNGEITLKATESVTIPYLNPTDEVYIVEKDLNMAQYNNPTAVIQFDELQHSQPISLTGNGSDSAKDWTTGHYTPVEAEKYIFTNNLKERELEVHKKWFNYEKVPLTGTIGKTITFTVEARYTDAGHELTAEVSQINSNGVDLPFELSDLTGWDKTFSHLPVCTPDGKQITYTVREQPVTGYTTAYDGNTTGNCTINNTEEPPAQITVKKEWYDAKGHSTEKHDNNIKYEVYQFCHQHDWGVWVEENGNKVWKDDEWIKDPDATEETTGTAYQVCKYDSSHTRIVELGTKDHNWELTENVEPTCTVGGHQTYVCSYNSDHTYTTYTEPLGHSWPETPNETIAPDCTSPGRKVYHCTRDGCTETKTEMGDPALGHDWGEWVIDRAPTATEKGLKHRNCGRCNAVDEEEYELPQNVFPGTTIPLDEILDWPTTETYPNTRETDPCWHTKITMNPSGIFKYDDGYYYVIYQSIQNEDALKFYSGPYGDSNLYNNRIARLTGNVKTLADWNNGNVEFGDVYVAEDGSGYVFIGNNTMNRNSPPENDNRWYKAYTAPTTTNPTNNSNSSSETRSSAPRRVNRTSANDSESDSNGAEEQNNAPVSGSNDNPGSVSFVLSDADKPGQIITDDGTPPSAEKTDLTVQQLMSDVNVTALNARSADSGNLLVKFGDERTLSTIGDSNDWSETINVPLTDPEGNLYTYYVVETSPQAASEDWDTTYLNQDNGLQNGGTVTIQNKEKVKDADLAVYKVGKDFNGGQSSETPLNGIGFTVYRYTDAEKKETEQEPYKAEQRTAVVEDKEGYTLFTELAPGDYQLVETTPPTSGYMVGGPWDIHVDQDGTLTLTGARGELVPEPEDGENTYTYKITNMQLYDLPSAGGSGTYLFTIIGVAIGTTAILLLTGDRRKVLWRKMDD